MPGRFHQQHGDHRPRILGWDVAGRIAPTIVADSRRLVDIFGLEPPGVPFMIYVEPGVERTSYRRGDPTTFFVGAQGVPPGTRGSMPAHAPDLAGEGMVTRTRRYPRSMGHEKN
jgi:hypothetical protein